MSLKGIPLEEYNGAMPEEEKRRIIEDNFKELRASLMRTGIRNIVEATLETELQVTGTAAEKVVPELSKAFKSSGGFVEVLFNGMVYLNGASTLALYLDNKRVDWMTSHGSAHLNPSLFWDGPLAAGNHNVEVRVTSSGGHVIEFSHDDSKSRLSVRETLL